MHFCSFGFDLTQNSFSSICKKKQMAGICRRVFSHHLRGTYSASRSFLSPGAPPKSCIKDYQAPSYSTACRASIPVSFPFIGRIPHIDGLYSRRYALWYPAMARSFFSKGQADKKPDAPEIPKLDVPDVPKAENQIIPKEIADAANDTFNYIRETAAATFASIQDAADKYLPVLKDKLENPAYSPETISQLMYTSVAVVLAWLVMPSILRRLHRYFEDGSSYLLGRSDKVPYKTSFWYALEDPAKVLISVVAFSQVGSLIAPTTISAEYVHQIWRGAGVVALVWFLHRWKSNVLSRVLSDQCLAPTEKERFLALDKISSIGLLLLGGMGVAETCGIAAQSVLTVGGVGGVATAFAARDILGNVLSGFALQFMKPFKIGDRIKAGSVEGHVLDIGLTSTKLLDNDKFPVSVPNSFFSSQVIVNKSRTWQTFTLNVPVDLNDFEKMAQITKDIRMMLQDHPKVTVQNGPPLCHTSSVSGSSLLLTVACNILFQTREDLYSAEQEITLETLQIVKKGGARLGFPISELA